MTPREIAQKALSMIELYYSEFLSDTKLPDTFVVKVMFYGTMIVTVEEKPLDNAMAQRLLMHDLWLLYQDAKTKLAKHIMSPNN